jgi:hypothetical protein
MDPSNPQRITGNWHYGISLDVQTISSTYLDTPPQL